MFRDLYLWSHITSFTHFLHKEFFQKRGVILPWIDCFNHFQNCQSNYRSYD
jgi:hypothetical protein